MQNKTTKRLYVGVSLAAVAAFIPATGFAQDAGTTETVVVSASRISIAGYQAPTPVTVVGTQQLEQEAHTDIGDTIRELPSVGTSSSPNNGSSAAFSGASAGLDTINLRNLGILRTLVLFDGQRVVQSNITGGVDLNTIPTSLVQRVDIVTGGASAAWGSDAVAGVVNLVINKNFTGFKGNVEGSDSYNDDHRAYQVEGAWGADFDGSRGRVILSAAHTDSPDAVFVPQTKWWDSTYLMNNPAYVAGNGQPRRVHASNVGLSQATPGGVITASPAGTSAPANALRGIQFTGTSGTPTPFNFGNITGVLAYGGDANASTNEDVTDTIAVPYRTTTLFGYAGYKLSDSIHASAQLNYGSSWSLNTAQSAAKFGNLVITADNPYIPAPVKAVMAAGGIPSFTMGNTGTNNLDINHLSFNSLEHALGTAVNRSTRQLMRGVFSLDGSLGNDWSWNAYYQHGETRVRLYLLDNTLNANLNNAYDAVTVTAANVGASGLALGSIACRSTLASPTNGCQPLNPFGNGVASGAAIAYVSPPGDFENITLNEDVASGSMQGTLPWALPAGPVAVAFGAEYRKEGGRTTADPRGASGGWYGGNFTPFAGQYNVEEGFVEVDAPLLRDSFVQSLDFNGAGRMTSYSTSGLVETWKLGLTSQVDDDVRLRTTWSTDIRAPDLSELFNKQQINTGSAVDPHTGLTQFILTVTGGNPNLVPEVASTVSGGVVLTPHWLDGLSVSADWYYINIKKAIYTTGTSQVLAQCNAGVAVYCSQLLFNGPGGALSQINSYALNANSQTVSGLDFQADYPMPLFDGSLVWHLLGNYNDEQTQKALGVTYDYAGSLGADSLVTGVPKFKLNLSATYTQGPFSGTVQGRLIGSAKLNNAWTSGVDVDDNAVPLVAYLDLRGSYRWSDALQFYGAIDNFTDVPAPSVPISPAASSTVYQNTTTRPDIYDALGRAYRVGVRVNL